MSRIPLSTFLPIKTPKAVTDLVKYLRALKPRERYTPRDCLNNITSDTLKRQFCQEVVDQDIYPISDTFIAYYITPEKAQKATNQFGNQAEVAQRLTKLLANNADEPKAQKDERIASDKLPPRDHSIENHITTENLIIAKNVKASSFTVKKGCIYYQNFTLESVRIPAIPNRVLATIEKTFTIRKDCRLSRKSNTGLRFIFEPATDLSELLTEATKASAKLGKGAIYIDNPVKGHGIFDLPWKYVLFREGYMCLIHPDAKGKETINPFRYTHHSIHKSYSNFLPYIERYATKLQVEGFDGRITRLLNFEDFAKIFPHLTSYASMDDDEIFIEKMRKNINRAYTIEEFRNAHFTDRSQFLAYLCEMQHPDYKIFYLLENIVHESSESAHDEFGYLFTISDSPLMLTLIYENISDESRSSIVFYIKRSEYESAVKFIARFLASDEVNKRLKLARNQVHFNSYIESYGRVSHTSYFEWCSQVNYLFRCGTTF